MIYIIISIAAWIALSLCSLYFMRDYEEMTTKEKHVFDEVLFSFTVGPLMLIAGGCVLVFAVPYNFIREKILK